MLTRAKEPAMPTDFHRRGAKNKSKMFSVLVGLVCPFSSELGSCCEVSSQNTEEERQEVTSCG